MTSESDQALNGINWEYLCQHWVRSDQEQQTDEYHIIYRPEGYKRPEDFKESPPNQLRFPPPHLTFYENGDFELCLPDLCGGRQTMHGKWKIDPNDKSVLQEFDKYDTSASYRIVELAKNLLRMI